MREPKLSLSILPEVLAVCRLDKDANIPSWASEGGFFCVVRTSDELSVVCREELVPEGVKMQNGWRAFKTEGVLDFALTGILASIAVPLAEAKISIFAVSTYDTDYVLVKMDKLQEAVKVLKPFFNIKD